MTIICNWQLVCRVQQMAPIQAGIYSRSTIIVSCLLIFLHTPSHRIVRQIVKCNATVLILFNIHNLTGAEAAQRPMAFQPQSEMRFN